MGFSENILDVISTLIVALPLKEFSHDVAEVVNYQFVDEIFHYRQLQHYLQGDWGYWDPKITTPPGLYYLTYLYANLTGVIQNLGNMRFFNLIGGLFIAVCCIWIRFNSSNPGFNTASILLNPLLALYYSLYYTDVWAAASIVLMYAIAIAKPFNSSKVTSLITAFVGILSLFMRQTNIVWCLFVLAAIIDQQVKEENGYKYANFYEDLKVFLSSTLKHKFCVIPFALVVAAFQYFVFVNGGITLGDKDNHVLVPHIAQFCYCLVFLTVFTLPLWISISFFVEYLKDNFGSLQALLFNSFWIPTLVVIIKNFTVIHPFILADNRHYTFYIVKTFITRTDTSRFELLPVYHFSFYVVYKLFIDSVSRTKPTASSLIMFLAWMGCTALTIIPSPLFEPRYYIVPFLMFRLIVQPYSKPIIGIKFMDGDNNRRIRYVAEVVWAWFWTQALYLVFLQFTFRWNDLVDPQRVIW